MIVVFWLENSAEGSVPRCALFGSDDLLKALDAANHLRLYADVSHVCISSELPGSVGKAGVSSVENGRTPDGLPYEWSKKHRGAGPRSDT